MADNTFAGATRGAPRAVAGTTRARGANSAGTNRLRLRSGAWFPAASGTDAAQRPRLWSDCEPFGPRPRTRLRTRCRHGTTEMAVGAALVRGAIDGPAAS